MANDFKDVINQCIQILEHIANDSSVPRNIRRSASDVLTTLKNEEDPLFMRTTASISILEDISNDPNIPLHTRTLIWNVASQLETIPVDD
ncbi:hypothetical protein Metho_0250 [Methanomethylovorans hollandica DSM 15978]|jgi:uncharacterized protein (UPF0147 family)|uniref:UPF0147 protein Metho_0250 n=1 Tax=Methanomethylovorans hollandica (strain DSM 15978 / NBRC 107637 / DMS1) TaxID=867904 RepID=L0KWS6_METHD|nr:UPF0147 family protein [Methanomethylovorans hollandica]AGB48528.1 hypothetical protein Metho_0250 [Methanomethylovorans hollandica DSM 15978]